MWLRQLQNELGRLFARKRTYMGLVVFLFGEGLIATLLRFAPAAHRALSRALERGGSNPAEYFSMLTVATLMTFLLSYTLLPLFAALVGGDLVSKEVEDGTLRMVLSRPISRGRLLIIKWLAGAIFSALLVAVLAVSGFFWGGLWFPADGKLFALLPDQVPGLLPCADGLRCFLIAHGFMVFKAVTIMSLALMFSCCNLKPAAATILTLSIFSLDRILMEMPFFHSLRMYFLGSYLNCWELVFVRPIPWWQIGESASLLAGLILTFFIVGAAIFQTRDIKS